MTNQQRFDLAISILGEIAPDEWTHLCAIYRFFDDLADIRLFCKEKASSDWEPLSINRFDLMDFFDAYREEVFPGLEEPWTILELYVDRSGSVKTHHGFGDPKITDRTLRIQPSS